MKPLKKPDKDIQNEFLRSKWGFTNPDTNSALERTHQDLLIYYSERPEISNKNLLEHFKDKLEWEKKWQKRKEESQYLP
jgi:hypothetical protein